MVQFILEDGKKGEHDVLVRVVSYGEVLRFEEVLFILKHYFQSEDSYYPLPRYRGRCMLVSAIMELAIGRDFDVILREYRLKRKGKQLNIVDKRKKGSAEVIEAQEKPVYIHDYM